MDLMLAQRRAVVIGGSRGIGAAIVHELAAEGAEVAFCGLEANGIALALEKLGTLASKVSGRALDLRDSEALKQWFDELQGFDILVLNASALSVDWDEAIALDLQANLAVAEAALPWLELSPVGALTYIGSKAGSLGAASSAAYGAIKAAMAHWVKSTSQRLAGKVRVNTISPGDILFDGGLWDQARLERPQDYHRALARNPLGRLGSPEEVARVVAFISSPAASFVTGSNWYVDGGSVAHAQF